MDSFMRDPNVAHTMACQVMTERMQQAENSRVARTIRRERREATRSNRPVVHASRWPGWAVLLRRRFA